MSPIRWRDRRYTHRYHCWRGQRLAQPGPRIRYELAVLVLEGYLERAGYKQARHQRYTSGACLENALPELDLQMWPSLKKGKTEVSSWYKMIRERAEFLFEDVLRGEFEGNALF